MNPETIDAAKEALTPLLDKLGELGAKGFELAMRQNYVYLIEDVVVLVVATIIFLIALRVLHGVCCAEVKDRSWIDAEGNVVTSYIDRNQHKEVITHYRGIMDFLSSGTGDKDYDGFLLMLGIPVVAYGIVFFCEVFPIINRLANPYWMALSDLLSLIGSR